MLNPINWDNKPKWQREMFEDFNRSCAFTGKTENITIDHLIPRRKAYGEVEPHFNLLPVCMSVNASKRNRHLFEWYEKYGERHGVTEERFRKSIEYVAEKIGMSFDEYREFYDRMYHRDELPKDSSDPDEDVSKILDFRKTKFIMIPKTLVSDENLSHRDRTAYMALCLYTNNDTKQAYPSIDTLAEKACCSRSSMIRALNVLEDSGYIRKENRFFGEQKQTTNVYILLDKD